MLTLLRPGWRSVGIGGYGPACGTRQSPKPICGAECVRARPPCGLVGQYRLEDIPFTIGELIAHDSTRSLGLRSEEHTSELQSLMRIPYAAFCLKKNKT